MASWGKFLLIKTEGFSAGCLSLLMKCESKANMGNIESEIEKKFGRKLRLRVNGLLVEQDKVLLIKHRMAEDRHFWNLPGGGMEYGADVPSNLQREFLEETGLEVEVGDFLFVYEFLEPPLHAVELFFEVKRMRGSLGLGTDPELSRENQIMTRLEFLSLEEVDKIEEEEKHRMLWKINSLDDIRKRKGYFYFGNYCIK